MGVSSRKPANTSNPDRVKRSIDSIVSRAPNGQKTTTTTVTPARDTDPLSLAEDDCGSPVTNPLSFGTCLFCDRHYNNNNSESAVADLLLAHMQSVHNFSVPYSHKLVDSVGLLKELGRIVGEERACLTCGRQFYGGSGFQPEANAAVKVSLAAVRQHMQQKQGHLTLWCGAEDPLTLALALAEAEERGQPPPSSVLAGGELFSRFYDGSVTVPSFVVPDSSEDVYEVRLPSGSVIGHRSMRTYYAQHLSSASASSVDDSRPNRSLTGGPRLALMAASTSAAAAARLGVVVPAAASTLLPAHTTDSNRRYEAARCARTMALGVRNNDTMRSRLRRQY